MTDAEARAFAKLLKLARRKTEQAAQRLAALDNALARVDQSLQLLRAAVSSEEETAKTAEIVGFAQLAGFLAGAAHKRAALLETRSTITRQQDEARADFDRLRLEMRKLEHLVERARGRRRRRDLKIGAAHLDASALIRFSRSKAG
jgi:flagellar export protein FliJ